VKKHHDKHVIKFGYLLVNGRLQKWKWSNSCHKNETESHQKCFWKVEVFLGKSINLKNTACADFAKIELKNHLMSKTTPW